MATEQTRVMTRDDVKNLVAEVLQQYQAPTREPSALKAGNTLTLSIFSELQFALRSRNLDGTGPIAQQFRAEMTTDGYLEFPQDLPRSARRVAVFFRGHPTQKRDLPATGHLDPIKLGNPTSVIAVALEDVHEKAQLVAFVSFVDRMSKGHDGYDQGHRGDTGNPTSK